MSRTQQYERTIMHLTILTLCILLIIGAARLLAIFIQRARSPLSRIPGPWYSQWTSLVLTYYWLRGQRAQYTQRLHEKYGRVVRLSPRAVDFSSISGAKRIHSFNRPFLKAQIYDALRSANGSPSVFSTRDLKIHARHRRLLSAPISEIGLRDVEHLVQARARLAVEKIGQEMKTYGAADVMKWWMFFSTDVIGELTFGNSFRMLEQGKANQYVRDLQGIAFQDGVRIAFPRIVKLASYLPLPLFSDTYAAMQRMRSYAEESICRYEKMVSEEPNKPKPTLFTKLFNAGEDTMSQPEIVAESQSYIVAGSDTTAHSLTYLTWAVCRNESIKTRLTKELEALPDAYQNEDLKALPYLNQIIQETLRVFAAAPALLPRDIPPGGCEIDGYWMPGGTEVQTQAYSMHRDPLVFPEPELFNPSRWESPSKEMKDAWMPFGGGARTCLGLHLAQLELRIATAQFFQAFPNARVSTREGFCDDDMEQVIYFLMVPKKKRCLIESF